MVPLCKNALAHSSNTATQAELNVIHSVEGENTKHTVGGIAVSTKECMSKIQFVSPLWSWLWSSRSRTVMSHLGRGKESVLQLMICRG